MWYNSYPVSRAILERRKYIFVVIIFFLILFSFFGHSNNAENEDSDTYDLYLAKRCLKKNFLEVLKEDFNTTWFTLNEKVNNCTDYFKNTIHLTEFINKDEIKYGYLPKSSKSLCNVITLGIGKDVLAESALATLNPKCKFLGVDPDEEESGSIYKILLNGTFIKGLVGAKAGIYETDVLVKGSNVVYKSETLMHYSFHDLLSKYYDRDIIDYLFIDIEGDEYALMKELIQNPEKYPTICHINVEYHSPFENNRGLDFFEDFYKSIKYGPFLPIHVNTFKQYFFNRMFLFNFDSKCVKKYL